MGKLPEETAAKMAGLEILAPAGSREAALAAINSGADAIYLAGERFGARAYAANFGEEELAEVVRYAHLRKVAVYVALNTLISDAEMPEALEQARRCYNLGADALIVQDPGLAAELRRLYPEIPLNASTQMTLMNSAAVRQAERDGFGRVILAREVSLSDIRAIRERAKAEIEVFVHGALCICFSGQCLFSSLVGGRSGNRGRCAQPCRLSYQLMGEKSGTVGQAGHLLSPKDLNAIELLPELAEAGVCSLKIEGRMKRPEYVAAVTAAYAAAKRGEEYDRQALAQAFNRGFTQAYLTSEPGVELMSYERPNNRGTRLGRIERIEYAEGALVLRLEGKLAPGDGLEIWVSRGGRQGFQVREFTELGNGRVRLPLGGIRGEVRLRELAVGDRVFKTADSALIAAGAAAYGTYDNLPVSFHFSGIMDERPVLQASYTDTDGETFRAEAAADYQIAAAKKHPADRALLERQLGRLGGSGWYLADLQAELDDGIMLPASVLNQLRRETLAALEQEILAGRGKLRRELPAKVRAGGRFNSGHSDSSNFNNINNEKNNELNFSVCVADLAGAQAAAVAGMDYIYWQGWRERFAPAVCPADLEQLAGLNRPVYGILPTAALERELELWRRRLRDWQQAGLAGVVVNNLWGFELLAEVDWPGKILAGFGLNSFNRAAAASWQDRANVERCCLSRELNGRQLAEICGNMAPGSCEVQVFGDLPVMNSRHCPIGALLGGREAGRACSGACGEDSYFLRDEKGYCFPVRTDEFCRSHIYNGYQLCLLEELPRLAALGAVLHLELGGLDGAAVGRICRIWRRAAGKSEAELTALKQELAEICIERGNNDKQVKFTKGHYFRGVE